MRRLNRIIVALLVLAVAAGSVIGAAQAASMAVDMSAVADGAMPGCDVCPGNSDGGMACAAACVSSTPAVLPAETGIAPLPGEKLAAARAQRLVDRHRLPDPHPPRMTVLG